MRRRPEYARFAAIDERFIDKTNRFCVLLPFSQPQPNTSAVVCGFGLPKNPPCCLVNELPLARDSCVSIVRANDSARQMTGGTHLRHAIFDGWCACCFRSSLLEHHKLLYPHSLSLSLSISPLKARPERRENHLEVCINGVAQGGYSFFLRNRWVTTTRALR